MEFCVLRNVKQNVKQAISDCSEMSFLKIYEIITKDKESHIIVELDNKPFVVDKQKLFSENYFLKTKKLPKNKAIAYAYATGLLAKYYDNMIYLYGITIKNSQLLYLDMSNKNSNSQHNVCFFPTLKSDKKAEHYLNQFNLSLSSYLSVSRYLNEYEIGRLKTDVPKISNLKFDIPMNGNTENHFDIDMITIGEIIAAGYRVFDKKLKYNSVENLFRMFCKNPDDISTLNESKSIDLKSNIERFVQLSKENNLYTKDNLDILLNTNTKEFKDDFLNEYNEYLKESNQALKYTSNVKLILDGYTIEEISLIKEKTEHEIEIELSYQLPPAKNINQKQLKEVFSNNRFRNTIEELYPVYGNDYQKYRDDPRLKECVDLLLLGAFLDIKEKEEIRKEEERIKSEYQTVVVEQTMTANQLYRDYSKYFKRLHKGLVIEDFYTEVKSAYDSQGDAYLREAVKLGIITKEEMKEYE